MGGEHTTIDELDSTLEDGNSEPRNIPLEYLRKITNNFSDDRLLGEGGFAKVYKGVLQNGKLVAAKKLGIQESQFQNEVFHLMRLKHPNIVRLIGYCYETRNECLQHNQKYIFAEMQQKLICLEYLPNGSLDRHLSGESSGHDWHTRYKIIKGICCGLHYLHDECQCQFSASIIHLDLKPSNILLDDNMAPKVADFGLSRLFEDNKTHTCATFLSGSLGYMAPEYLIGRIVTTKADVYNLGVIIMEIITGSKVNIFSYSSPTSWQDFVECVLENWRNRLEAPPSETDCKQIKFCLEIGLDCIKLNREERPTIREIMERLDRWESTNCYANNNNEESSPADQSDINERASAGPDNNDGDTGGLRLCGLPNWTRVRGLVRGKLSRVMRLMTKHLSCLLMTRKRCMRPWPMYGYAMEDDPAENVGSPSWLEVPAEKFTFAQLEATTNGFALEAKIGAGSFGTVYRGKLPDGHDVAIKRILKESVFLSELTFLSRYHHKHIIGLVGYCEENEEHLLVYEYMKNGALYDHLHPEVTPSASSPSPVMSSWKLRIKILLDASRGMAYLHSYANTIHCDIKSSHILLDADWTACVSGFGLLLTTVESEVQVHLDVEGTPGYMDPEYSYGLHHHLSVKSDVYGFGVVMLEVLTGKLAIFKEAEGGSPVSVVDYAVPSIVAGELSKVLDPRAPEPAAYEAKAIELVAYTALHCVRLEGKDRPAMADIVANLKTALALCEGSSAGGGFGPHSPSRASPSVKPMNQDEALV